MRQDFDSDQDSENDGTSDARLTNREMYTC